MVALHGTNMSDQGITIPSDRELIFDWPAIDAAMTRMAAEITADLAGERPIYMTILTGGLPCAFSCALSASRLV